MSVNSLTKYNADVITCDQLTTLRNITTNGNLNVPSGNVSINGNLSVTSFNTYNNICPVGGPFTTVNEPITFHQLGPLCIMILPNIVTTATLSNVITISNIPISMLYPPVDQVMSCSINANGQVILGMVLISSSLNYITISGLGGVPFATGGPAGFLGQAIVWSL